MRVQYEGGADDVGITEGSALVLVGERGSADGVEVSVLARLQAMALNVVPEQLLLLGENKIAATDKGVVVVRLGAGIGEVAATGSVRRGVRLRVVLQCSGGDWINGGDFVSGDRLTDYAGFATAGTGRA